MQPFAEVVETFGGQGVVVVLPRELSFKVSAGSQGLAGLDDLFCASRLVGALVLKMRQERPYEEVLGVNVLVLGEVEVLLRDKDTLYISRISQPAVPCCSLLLFPDVQLSPPYHSNTSKILPHNPQFRKSKDKDKSLPRKRYSWIFLRSDLGISLPRTEPR